MLLKDISFVIPVYNRPNEIDELLKSFSRLEGDKDFEIPRQRARVEGVRAERRGVGIVVLAVLVGGAARHDRIYVVALNVAAALRCN